MTDTSYAPGARVVIRDEEWVVRSAESTDRNGTLVRAIGQSALVNGVEASFFTDLDEITQLRPEETELVTEDSSRYIHSRLFLEAILRRTPLPRTENGLAMTDKFLMNPMTYQQRPAELALRGLRPRILIADVVGLGKTLEIGLTLAELIRRGRGERILVVTPQHVLEQFQREMWTRFSIPLLRMDSVGISRIQQQLPAGRNPFLVHKRVIISIDTLKNESAYRHHLENLHWDAVVMDESHNLVGGQSKSQRRKLAELLADKTDALLLASATPHNGDSKSFAGLVDLLDPTAIADKNDYQASDIKDLYIRRTKVDPEVRAEIASKWADRGETHLVDVQPSDEEEAVFQELAATWNPRTTTVIDANRKLFPFTLIKAFLSSPKALGETVRNRLASQHIGDKEKKALEWLRDLNDGVKEPAKLLALKERLKEIGVGPKSTQRAVIFSERVPTVKWLAEEVPKMTKLKPSQIRVLHGALSDVEQQRVVEEFSLGASDVRVLITGDIASEGVNLHTQCHQLIHWDVPWSMIRIEQRNGRIDRFGQLTAPEFTALLLKSQKFSEFDDARVSGKLIAKAREAAKDLGSVEAIVSDPDPETEERHFLERLFNGQSADDAVEAEEDDARDALMDFLNSADEDQPSEVDAGAQPPAKASESRLFDGTLDFVEAALDVLGIPTDQEGDTLLITPPEDLKKRLQVLPPSYLKEHKLTERLLLTRDFRKAEQRLKAAADDTATAWPDIAYLSDLHPLVDWLVDKALVRLGRGRAPVIVADVGEPTFCVQGVYSNGAGKPAVVEWMAITGLPNNPSVSPMAEALHAAGVGPSMPNPGLATVPAGLQSLVTSAVDAAREYLEVQRASWDEEIKAEINRHLSHVDGWEQRALAGLDELIPASKRKKKSIDSTADKQRERIEKLAAEGEPLLRVLAVLVPQGEGA